MHRIVGQRGIMDEEEEGHNGWGGGGNSAKIKVSIMKEVTCS